MFIEKLKDLATILDLCSNTATIIWKQVTFAASGCYYKIQLTRWLINNKNYFSAAEIVGFPSGLVVKNLPSNEEDVDPIPWPGRSPGEGNRNPLQYSCLENPMDRRTWWGLQSMGFQRVKHDLVIESESRSVQFFATPWTIPSMEFSRPFPSPGDIPNPGIEPRSPTLQADSLPAEPQGKPKNMGVGSVSLLLQIFPTQESNWSLLHCRWILYQLCYQGSPDLVTK